MPSLRSMRVQTAAIIVVSFLLSHVAGLLFYRLDRQGALEMTEAVDLAERAAGISRLVRDLPPDWRNNIVLFSDSRAFRVWNSSEPAVSMPEPTEAELDVVTYLRTQLPRITDHDMRVRFIEDFGDRLVPPPFDPSNRAGSPASALDEVQDGPSVAISVHHGDGEWLNFLGLINTPRSLVPELFLANVVSAAVGVALVAFWLVNRVTSPLAHLSIAAERLGRNLTSSPLPVTGPKEVAVAAAAFNRMQHRLLRLIQSRTELLAGISHDLRTPLTQLRLRLELMPPSLDREKNLRTLDELDAIIGTFLTYARAAHEAEERSRTDVGALVESICDDLADCGAAIEYTGEPGLVVSCKRLAIKRAVTNLVQNALRYGHEARVSASRANGCAIVAVEDSGPGIPEAQLEAVFAPFHRGEQTDGSGMGLGLSLAQAIAEDHGGDVQLVNRSEGGLRAELILPLG